ncbi:MAG: hypothetical protein ACLFTI_01170 [Anaerolineales bacterium]
MIGTPQTKQISADFFTQGYRISGIFNMHKRLLADIVYDPTTDYIEIYDAYVSPIMDPARISAHYNSTLVTKPHLDFFLTTNLKDGLRRDQQYGHSLQRYPVFITVPFFEITGEILSSMHSFRGRLFLTEAGTFITVLNITARSTFNPDVVYEGAVAQVNREKIGCFGKKVD